MRIAIVGNSASSHIVKWANAIKQRGHTVALFSFDQHAAPPGTLNPEIRHISIGSFSKYKIRHCAQNLKKELQIYSPDITHIFYAAAYASVARLAGAKHRIITVMGSDVYAFADRGPLSRLILRYNFSGCHAITSASYAMKKRTRLFTSKPIHIIPFGVDTSLFCPAGHTHTDIRIAFVKLFKPIYAPKDMLYAFDRLKRRLDAENHPLAGAVHLDLYGSGPLEPQIRHMAAISPYAPFIHFHGYTDNRSLPAALQQCSIFCATSLQESFGVSLIEAMACGLPVVCSNADGFCEVVCDGETGLIVPHGDCDKLAKALYRLVCDPQLRMRMGQAGRRRAVLLYEARESVDKMLLLYKQTTLS